MMKSYTLPYSVSVPYSVSSTRTHCVPKIPVQNQALTTCSLCGPIFQVKLQISRRRSLWHIPTDLFYGPRLATLAAPSILKTEYKETALDLTTTTRFVILELAPIARVISCWRDKVVVIAHLRTTFTSKLVLKQTMTTTLSHVSRR